MRKIAIHSAGGYDKLKMEEHPDPSPGKGEVRVRVAFSGVNYADVCVRWGVYESAKQYVGWPITPGFEYSGTVDAVGEGVTRFRPGDQVFGLTFFNGYSSCVCVPEHQLFALPSRLSLKEAAGFPAVYFTAYHALFQAVRVRPGMTILVHSAAGGVGSALVQQGKIAGCRVIAVVGSSHKVEYARSLGADEVVDKSRQDLWKEVERLAPDGCDVILDANGYITLKEGYRHLRPTGKLVVYGSHSLLPRSGGRINYIQAALGLLKTPRFNPLDLMTDNKGVVGFNLSFLFSRTDLMAEATQELLVWLEEGKLQPSRTRDFPAEKVAEAHAAIESGQSMGKLVLDWGSNS